MTHDPFPHPDSSTIESHSYDGQHLTVTYRTGATYRYHDVPSHKVDGLRAASSANGYLHELIKPAHRVERL